MSRLPTNISAMSAVAARAPTEQNLKGLANSTAARNPAHLSIATKMTSDAGALSTVNDALNKSKSLVSPTSPALNSTIPVIDAMDNDLITASQPGAQLDNIETDIAAQQQSLLSIGSSMNIAAATAGHLADALTDVETAIGSITTAASTLGATTTKLPTQRTYVSNLSDSLTTGVGALIGTNMNEAATKLAALRGEQQVGAQALSISNSNTKLILKLFEL
jgi:flagellin-like hook-associated protein FlgL